MNNALKAAILSLALAGCGGTGAADDVAAPAANAPVKVSGVTTVILLGGGANDTLSGAGMVPVGPTLVRAGFSVLTLDLPCHGADGDGGLTCWRSRIEGGDEKLFTNFCARLSKEIDALEVTSIVAVGISRGAYVALTCAAYDSRISAIGLIAPVTDLQRLEEFNGYAVNKEVFGLAQHRAVLANRPMMLRMNRTDPRVGTDAALAFIEGFPRVIVEIIEATGHGVPEDGSTAMWVRSLH